MPGKNHLTRHSVWFNDVESGTITFLRRDDGEARWYLLIRGIDPEVLTGVVLEVLTFEPITGIKRDFDQWFVLTDIVIVLYSSEGQGCANLNFLLLVNVVDRAPDVRVFTRSSGRLQFDVPEGVFRDIWGLVDDD